MKSNVHIKINDPTAIRANLLYSAKTVAEQLQNYNKIKVIRAEKKRQIARVEVLMKEVHGMFSNLGIKDVPYAHLDERTEEVKKETKHVKTESFDVDTQLEKELLEIERKLAMLR